MFDSQNGSLPVCSPPVRRVKEVECRLEGEHCCHGVLYGGEIKGLVDGGETPTWMCSPHVLFTSLLSSVRRRSNTWASVS